MKTFTGVKFFWLKRIKYIVMFAFYNNVVEIHIFINQCIQQVLCCKMNEIEPRFLVFCKGFPLMMEFVFLGLANDLLCITVTSLVRTNNKRMRARLKKPNFLIKNHKLGLRYILSSKWKRLVNVEIIRVPKVCIIKEARP